MFAPLLVDFLFRLTFGIAVAMAMTSSRDVTSGFFRVHLWVLLGLQTLATVACISIGVALPEGNQLFAKIQFWLALAGAIVSYVGAVLWLYERSFAGKIAIRFVATCALLGCLVPLLDLWTLSPSGLLRAADRLTSGRLLGFVVTAMLLGHWYLNSPTMKLEPLKKLLFRLGIAVLFRMLICGIGAGLAMTLTSRLMPLDTWFLFLALRWLSGLIGVLVLTWMAWQTLKITNTQSATGILYAAVVLVFIGELTSQLLTAQSLYPV